MTMTFEEHVDLLKGVGFDSSGLRQSYNNLFGLNNPYGVDEAASRFRQQHALAQAQAQPQCGVEMEWAQARANERNRAQFIWCTGSGKWCLSSSPPLSDVDFVTLEPDRTQTAQPHKFRTAFWEKETKSRRCQRFFLFIFWKLLSGIAWLVFWWLCLKVAGVTIIRP